MLVIQFYYSVLILWQKERKITHNEKFSNNYISSDFLYINLWLNQLTGV